MSYDSISPIDGRYAAEAKPLAGFFSERALAEERLKVELAYLRLLVALGVAPRTSPGAGLLRDPAQDNREGGGPRRKGGRTLHQRGAEEQGPP